MIMRAGSRSIWRCFVVLTLLCLSAMPAVSTRAAGRTHVLLQYAFRPGAVFTMRFSLTSTEAIEQPHYADRHFREVTTGLEQATIERVFADGAALFSYHLAGLADAYSASPPSLVEDTGGGPPAPVAAARYTITQAVSSVGRAESATQQCSPHAGSDQFWPFTLVPLPPVPYPLHPVTVGDVWTAPLPPDDDVVGQAQVRFTSQDGAAGSFRETALVPMQILDPKVLGHISGTTAITTTMTQDLVTGVPSSWGQQVTTRVSRTDIPLKPGKPVSLRIQSSQTLHVTLVPDATFAATSATPLPTPAPFGAPIATPVVKALSPAESALAAVNLSLADVPACYHVSASLPATPSVTSSLFPTVAISGLRAGHVITLLWYPSIGQSGIAAAVLRFMDVAHAHAFFVRLSKAPQPPKVLPLDLHGLRLGDEQREQSSGAYGPFDLALRELGYNNRPGQFDLIFRRGSDVVALSLLGDFAPIDLGVYGQRIDTRLQRAQAGGAGAS
jgi:hypothetical protein